MLQGPIYVWFSYSKLYADQPTKHNMKPYVSFSKEVPFSQRTHVKLVVKSFQELLAMLKII